MGYPNVGIYLKYDTYSYYSFSVSLEDFERVKKFITNVDCIGQSGKTLLHIAAGTQNSEALVRLLVEDCKADVNARAARVKIPPNGPVSPSISFSVEDVEDIVPQSYYEKIMNPWVPQYPSLMALLVHTHYGGGLWGQGNVSSTLLNPDNDGYYPIHEVFFYFTANFYSVIHGNPDIEFNILNSAVSSE